MSGENWPERIERATPLKLVIAGNHKEFKAWCRDRKRMAGVDAIFISKREQLLGYDSEKCVIVLVGTYGMNPAFGCEEWRRFPYDSNRFSRDKNPEKK
jgi:hypothetical protein